MPIFISYSHRDKEFADKLALQLVANKAHVWVDRWELKVGDSLINKVQEAIQGASALLVILSNASVSSEWCKKELTAGLLRELEEKKVVVLPVLKEECPIPLFLRDKLYADFRTDFDEGFRAVLESTARVTSTDRGRIDAAEYFSDWSMDWFDEKDLFCLRFTLVEHAANTRLSALSEVTVRVNPVATRRYRQYASAGLDWFGRNLIVEMLADRCEKERLFILLEDQFPKELNIEYHDKKTDAGYEISAKARLLGEDTGSNTLLNLGGQLNDIRNTIRQNSRKLSSDEAARAVAIMKTPIGS